MDYEFLFLFVMFLCWGLFMWNCSLLDSRYFWRKKYEILLKKIEESDFYEEK